MKLRSEISNEILKMIEIYARDVFALVNLRSEAIKDEDH